MKLSLNWLKEYIDPELSTDALVERLTMAGLEVEAVATLAEDTVLEIEVTPNRPDCLNILGLAREIGAITGKKVQWPSVFSYPTKELKELVEIENTQDCSHYLATVLRDVVIKDAPALMQARLTSLGMPCVNNVVDITNFVLMETGQPLHAFDYDKIEGSVFVRRARKDENLVTLDGIKRLLDETILVIADQKKVLAIAGIMGGQETQITRSTKSILLESAHFDMGLIRRASRRLGLRTEAAYRFERNMDSAGVWTGLDRAVDLLVSLTGARIEGRAEAGPRFNKIQQPIEVRVSEVEALLGISVTGAQMERWLTGLGLKVTTQVDGVSVVPPSYRMDLTQEVDVIEEIARMIGFDKIPLSLPMVPITQISVDRNVRSLKDKIRRVLAASSIDEIITHALIHKKALTKSNLEAMTAVRVFNALSQDQEWMRPSIVPSLMQTVLTNIHRGQKELRFFEIGKIYDKEGEKEILGIVMTRPKAFKKEGIDFLDIKGVVERVLESVSFPAMYEKNTTPAYDSACTARMYGAGQDVGVLGRIDPMVLSAWDIKNQEVYCAEFYLDRIFSLRKQKFVYEPISEFPIVVRDVSLAVKKEVTYQQVKDICLEYGKEILQAIHFIECYDGDKLPRGQKAFVFSCHYQSWQKTLREEEVASVHEKVLQALEHTLGASRR